MANAIFQNEPAAVPQSSLARGNAAAPAVATHRFTARTTVWTTTLGFFFFCVFATCGVALSTENAGFSTVAVSAMDSKEYYQYQLLMATTAVEHDNNDDEDWDLFGSYYNENSSHQCSSSAWEKVCCLAHCNNYYYSSSSPNDKPLWWLVLQWMKMMLFKMLRTYHAKPVILIIGPLLMGLLVGYWLGLQQPLETRQESTKIMTKSKDTTAEKGTSVSAPTLLSTRIRVALKAALDGSSIVCAHILVFIGILWNCVYIRQKTDLAEIYIGPSDRSSSTVRSAPSNGAAVKSIDEGSHNTDDLLEEREANVRTNLKSDRGIFQESGVPESQVPKHVAVIMDGNRRYGKSKYGSASRGHWEGSSKLVEFAKWCLAEKVQVLTVFAFSSENWNRDPVEVASLMQIFAKYCDELRIEAVKKDIKLVVLSTDQEKIPAHVRQGAQRMQDDTQHCKSMIMNICLSYGSRDEIVGATKSVVQGVLDGDIDANSIDEATFHRHLLTYHSGGDPDVLIRTSGEVRISNFLLWQLAYTEMFFIGKPWPAVDKDDLLQVIRTYAKGRHRRYGK